MQVTEQQYWCSSFTELSQVQMKAASNALFIVQSSRGLKCIIGHKNKVTYEEPLLCKYIQYYCVHFSAGNEPDQVN